ncbi:unnamed protein product [Durusdinium trenchii]
MEGVEAARLNELRILPQSLRSLSFCDHLNQCQMEHVQWPSGLQRLVLGDGFNKRLDHVAWPSSLCSLTLSASFNQTVEGVRSCWMIGRLLLHLPRTWIAGRPALLMLLLIGLLTLANVILRPWHAIIHLKHPMVRTWAYCDDRSLRCSGTLEDLNEALASTRRFDDVVGFSENMKKRQIWANNDAVEHLSLSVCPASQDLPTLRNGWDAIADNFPFLAKIPGGVMPRENAVRVFFKSKWTWPVPLIAPPPVSFVSKLFHQLLNHTKCSWWCSGRFWADRIDIHPIFGLACAAVLSAHRFHNPPPNAVFRAVKFYLELLDLHLVSWDNRGLYFSVNPQNQNLSRFVSAYGESIKLMPEGVPPHVLRVAARHKSLLQIRPSRLDSEDFSNIDVEASSHPLWSTWRAKLSRKNLIVLNIYRGGAIQTPTRGGYSHDPSCPFCNAQLASMRHFWALCPKFRAKRDFLEGFFKSLLVGGHFSLASPPKVVGLCFLQPFRLCKEPNARLLLVSLLSKSTMLCIPFLLLLRFFSGFRLDCFHLPSGACILRQGFLSLPLSVQSPVLTGVRLTTYGLRLAHALFFLTFGNMFNQSLEGVSWPRELQNFTFGHYFNQSLARVSWPNGLQTLNFGMDFNQRLEEVRWPSSLRSLKLGDCFNQSLLGVAWPSSLRQITFGLQFNQSLEGVTWPESFQHLMLGDFFNQPLKGIAWPNLEVLAFGSSFNQPLEGLPASLVTLSLSRNFDQPFGGPSRWPSNLQRVSFGDRFNCSLEHVTWPCHLRSVRFGRNFNQRLQTTWPNCLESLRLGEFFDQSLEGATFPGSLQSLTLGSRFNQSLDNVTFPSSLQTLELGDGFNQSLEQFDFPCNLQQLTFGDRFNQELEGVTFPPSLQSVTFGAEFDQLIQGVTWPVDLQSLTFGEGFMQSLDGVTWPNNLLHLKLGDRFNQPLEGVALPRKLQSLTLGAQFQGSVEGVTWPDHLQNLTFRGPIGHQNLERVTWPCNLLSLTLDVGRDKPLLGAILPNTLQSLTLTSHDFVQIQRTNPYLIDRFRTNLAAVALPRGLRHFKCLGLVLKALEDDTNEV